MLSSIKRISCLLGVGACLIAGQRALAGEIVRFQPFPNAPGLTDIALTGSGATKQLITGSGFSTSTGDGSLALSAQPGPGMDISTPFKISGVPGGVVELNNSTDFYDSTMTISNLQVDQPAQSTALPGGAGTLLYQEYSSAGTMEIASFTLASTTGGGGPVTLLTGTLSFATLTGLQGSSATSVLSATVTYTGGLIYTAMINNGYVATPGNMSIAMTQLTDTEDNPTGLSIANDGYIADVFAQATGEFDAPVATPEPASLGLIAMAALPLMRRRR
jgi:MYXO-CTERM domain-containing protein